MSNLQQDIINMVRSFTAADARDQRHFGTSKEGN